MASIKYLILDGELSGTGLRDPYESGYLNPAVLNLSPEIITRISIWIKEYENLHFEGYKNKSEIHKLDMKGIELAKDIRSQLTNVKVEYFSAAEMKKILF